MYLRKKKKEYTVLFEVFCSYSIRFVSGGFYFKNVELRRTCYEYHHDEIWHDGNGYAHVRAALIEFTNTVNKIVEVVKFVAFTLIIVKIVDFFPKKAIVQNESNNEISL